MPCMFTECQTVKRTLNITTLHTAITLNLKSSLHRVINNFVEFTDVRLVACVITE